MRETPSPRDRMADIANQVLEAFEKGSVPQAIAFAVLPVPGIPCSQWSRRNRLIVAFAGHRDARGFKQWKDVGRSVRKGERAFSILGPRTSLRKETDPVTGEESTYAAMRGVVAIPVFGFSQTEGADLADNGVGEFLDGLPLREVAHAWGVPVLPFASTEYAGLFSRNVDIEGTERPLIQLATRSLYVWLHELMHAADRRSGSDDPPGALPELVADLGSLTLLSILGLSLGEDTGFAYRHIAAQAKTPAEALATAWTVLDRATAAVDLVLETARGCAAEQLAA